MSDTRPNIVVCQDDGIGARSSTLFAHELFALQARREGTRAAVSFEGDFLTYAELNEKSNQLAHYLLSHGFASDLRVCVLVEPSVHISVALLGILKAGAVYVPLGQGFPREYLAGLLADVDPQVILTTTKLRDELPETKADVVCLDSQTEKFRSYPVHDPEIEIDPSSPAHIFYTSGTTGKPKGVVSTYGNLAFYIGSIVERYGFDSTLVIPSIARYTFSISFFELLTPLAIGGTLVVLNRDTVLDLDLLIKALERVTAVHASPSLYRRLLAHIDDEGIERKQFDGLKHVSTGGDLVPPDVLESMKRIFRDAEVFVIYGCTEVCCMGCTYFVPRGKVLEKTLVGSPFRNVTVGVFDEALNRVSAGVVGEVLISGNGVTKEYLNQPGLTREKFLEIDGVRFYRTGDRGRLDENGNLEILGRTDFQIKLRGFRIEPAEIETVIRQLPGVRDCVVSLQTLNSGDSGLVAYLVLHPTRPAEISEIRSHLKAKLPDYMVPSAFVEMESLPVNLNLKVDRKALPPFLTIKKQVGSKNGSVQLLQASERSESLFKSNLDISRSNSAALGKKDDPRNSTEEKLVEIWREVLGIDDIGVNENFFDLGGHSLLATQVLSRVRRTFEADISITSFFEFSTVAEIASLLEIRPLSNLRPGDSPIRAVSREDRLPLSSAQRRLWFLDKLQPDSPTYNIPLGMRMTGPLDRNALTKSLGKLVKRHESLRTTIGSEGGEAFLRIASELKVELPFIDLLAFPEKEREDRMLQITTEKARQPFDLELGPLFRVSLLRLKDDEHILMVTMHHIISDGWSLAIFLDELSEIYASIGEGRSPALPPLPVQFADYAVWQNAHIQGDVLQRQLEYWKQRLAGAPALVSLTEDYRRPAVQQHKGSHFPVNIPGELVSELKKLSRREGTTLYITMLAAFKTLLCRLTSQEDIVIASPIANRTHEETEGLIGFFVNTLALRTDLSGDPTFRELLAREKVTALEAYDHQDIPFEKLVEVLNPERNLSYNPLFQISFVLHNTPDPNPGLTGLKLSVVEIETGVSMFDMSVALREEMDGVTGTVEYDTELYRESTIARLVGSYETLLRNLVENPDLNISRVPILSDAEQHKLLNEWNGTKPEYVNAKPVHELFEEHAKRTPNAVAVVYGSDEITYQQLNEKANKLARHLRARGVSVGTLVGIYVDRSFDTIISMLAVLKAGGAYVPLDFHSPPERLGFILDDAELGFLISTRPASSELNTHRAEVILVDEIFGEIGGEIGEDLGNGVGADDPIYVIYTSGSTGDPKGVVVTHKNVARLLTSTEQWFRFDERDVWTFFHSFAFDFSVWEIWGALAYGGRLVVVPFSVSRSPKEFCKLLEDEKVTVLNQTPSAFRQLIHADASDPVKHNYALRYVIFGGEALDYQSLKPWIDRYGARSTRLVNMYGITETTVHVTYRVVGEADVQEGVPSYIGVPIPDLTLHILDAGLNPVPVGVAGELHVGGDGLAAGYLNRPELTAERFVRDPFSSDADARLYRTGDLARRLPGGEIEYLGRADNQVKIRGFRIELGEIESAIAAYRDVREAAVQVVDDSGAGGKKLAAYVVSSTHSEIRMADLRKHLKLKLPEYMVPADYVQLEQMPLTANGKIDRKALPMPERRREAAGEEYTAPRNETEERLARIWGEVLGMDNIGVRDNFFDLGGHSLLAIRMFFVVEETFRKNVPLATLFEAGTIEKLAEILEREDWQEPESSIVPIQPKGDKPPLYCVHAKGGNVLFYKDLANRLGDRQPLYGIQARRIGGRQVAHSTVKEMATFYISQMKSIQPNGPYYVCGSSFGGIAAFEMAQQLKAAGDEVAFLGLLDASTPSYPVPLPGNGFLVKKANGNLRRFQHHCRTLAVVPSGDRLKYVSDRLKKGWVRVRRVANNTYLKTIRGFYKRFREDEPLPSRYIQIEDKIWAAGMRYVPKPYPGKITLFRATNQPWGIVPDPTLGWEGISKNLEIHEVTGNHGSLVAEPYVGGLVDKLQGCLATVRTEFQQSAEIHADANGANSGKSQISTYNGRKKRQKKQT